MPLVLTFLRIRFEQLIVVWVNVGGISDGLGRDGYGERCVGNGGRHHLNYGRYEAPEDIISNVRICCVFVSVALISWRPFSIVFSAVISAGSNKIG